MQRLLSWTLNETARNQKLSAGLLVLRVAFGIAFVLHGFGKIQTPFAWMGPDSSTPAVFQFLAALSEFGGGIAMILGLLTPVAALGILSTMAVAVWSHVGRGDPFVGRPASWELAGIYFCVALLFLLAGPGRYSADYYVFGKVRK